MERNVYAVLEMGSYELRLIITEFTDEKQYLLDVITVPSNGIENGTVIDKSKLKEDIDKILEASKSFLNQDLKSLVLSLPSIGLSNVLVSDKVEINNYVSGMTVKQLFKKIYVKTDNANRKAKKDKEIASIVPVEFKADDVLSKDVPSGKFVKELVLNASVVSVDRNIVVDLVDVLNEIGIEVFDIVPSVIGQPFTLFNESDYKKNLCVVDIGEDTTTISTFNNGIMINSETLLIGAGKVTEHIVEHTNLSYDLVDDIKKNYGAVDKNNIDEEEILCYKSKAGIEEILTTSVLSRLMTRKYIDLLNVVKKFLVEYSTRSKFEQFIFVGGGSCVKGFQTLLENNFDVNSIVKQPDILSVDEPKYSSIVGVSKFMHFLEKIYGEKYNVLTGEIYTKVIDTPIISNEEELIAEDVNTQPQVMSIQEEIEDHKKESKQREEEKDETSNILDIFYGG